MSWWDDECPADLIAKWRAAPQDGRDGLLTVRGPKAIKRARERRRQSPERKALLAHHSKKRQMLQQQRTPAWADLDAILAVYLEASRLQQETGTPHHVDHFYPLNGRLVCGLHVAANLRAIPASVNLRKSNSMPGRLEESGSVRKRSLDHLTVNGRKPLI